VVTYLPKKASILGAFLIFGLLFWQLSTIAAETVGVRQVVDGDSLHLVDGRKVRLIGINSPELGRDGKTDEPLAVKARDELEKMLAAQVIKLKLGPDNTDRYGRTLAYVMLPDGSSAGEKMLRMGLASMIAIPPNVGHLDRYRQAEVSARQQRIGIWAHPFYQPTAASSLDHTKTGYRFVHGRIQRVGKSRKYYYFDLSPNFSIAIKRDHWHYFGGSPERWQGRNIIVRGWITTMSDKLRMRIGHLAMIEVLP
jgi:endonuclease YncB( thermonuclease family)